MGLSENCELLVCRCGEPCIVKINSTRLGLSRAMAEHIFVAPLSDSA
jgi:Fe2+ transport system protein FeoA